ncbi:MAG: signal peptidase II [Acidobacteriota bacterium]
MSGSHGPAKRHGLYLYLALGVTALDQASKSWISHLLEGTATLEIWPGFFRLVLVHNRGALFGMFQNLAPPARMLVFLALPITVIALLVWLALRTALSDRLAHWAFTLLLGGALGNLVDRIRLGYVVDFLDVYFIGPGGTAYHWPAFNLADACICTGIGLLALDSLRTRRISAPGAHHASRSI